MQIRQRADGGSVTSLLTPYSPPIRREASNASTVDICPPGPVGRRGETRGQRTKVTHSLEMQPGALRSLPPCCAVSSEAAKRIKATHLSTREYEHESCPSCCHPPGEEGPQQGLEHRAVALEHAGYGCVERARGSAAGSPFRR